MDIQDELNTAETQTFESFIVGPSNYMAHSIAYHIAELLSMFPQSTITKTDEHYC